jgi:hypothetical protein
MGTGASRASRAQASTFSGGIGSSSQAIGTSPHSATSRSAASGVRCTHAASTTRRAPERSPSRAVCRMRRVTALSGARAILTTS